MDSNNKNSILLCVVFSVITLVLLVFFMNTAPEPPSLKIPGRITVIGIDGFSWPPLLDLLKQGSLPTIASIMQQGTYGDLKCEPPDRTVHIWTTIATGVREDKHAVVTRFRKEQQGPRLTLSSDWLYPHVAHFLSKAGIPSLLIGWPATYPSWKHFGLNASDLVSPPWGTFSDAELTTLPNTMYPGIEREVLPGESGCFSEILDIMATHFAGEKMDRIRQALIADDKNFQTTLYLQRKYHFPVTFLYLGSYHLLIKEISTSKMLPLRADEPSPRYTYQIKQDYEEILEMYLVILDTMLEELYSGRKKNDTCMLFSGRGLVPGSIDNVKNDLDVSLAFGMFAFEGPAFKENNRPVLGGVLEIAPTILYLLDLPLPDSIDGGPMMLAIREDVAFHRKVRFDKHENMTKTITYLK